MKKTVFSVGLLLAIAFQVAVTQGEPGEIESVGIAEGTITVETQGATTDISVVGDAGC